MEIAFPDFPLKLLRYIISQHVPQSLRNPWNYVDWEQEAWLAVALATKRFDSDKGAWGGFAYGSIVFHMRTLVRRTATRATFCAHMNDDMWESLVAYSRPSHSLLSIWCDNRNMRINLPWRARLILYLRYVERWSLQEVATLFGVTRQAVSSMQLRAEDDLQRRL